MKTTAPKKKGRKPSVTKKERTNLLVNRDIYNRFIRCHEVSDKRYLYQTIEMAVELLEAKCLK